MFVCNFKTRLYLYGIERSVTLSIAGAATGAYIFPFLLASKHRTGSGSGSEGSLTGGSGLRDCMLVCALVAVMGECVNKSLSARVGAC